MKLIQLLTIISIGIAQPKYFDPDGYYYPSKVDDVGGLIIESFNISSLEYYVNGKLDYNNPKIVKPEVLILFVGDSTVTFAKNIILNKDTLSFEVDIPGEKRILFNGVFLDKRGQYWDQKDIVPQQTILVTGSVKLIQQGKVVVSKKMEFTYWEGD